MHAWPVEPGEEGVLEDHVGRLAAMRCLRYAAMRCLRALGCLLLFLVPRTALAQPAPPVRPGLVPKSAKGGAVTTVGKRCAAGEKVDCIDVKDCRVYIGGHTYDLSGLSKSTGFEAKGDNSQGYDYYINFCKHISSPPASACAQAKGDCAADKYGGCAAFQVSSDKTSCYACGNVGSLVGTFYDPSADAVLDPGRGLTMIMSSGLSPDPTSNRWLVVRLVCDRGETTEMPGKTRELTPPGGVYEVFWSNDAGCPRQLGWGTIFLISLASISVLYFGGGFFMNHRKGADVWHPHAEFWASLPDLCKDGYFFTMEKSQGLKGTPSADERLL